MFNLLLSFIIAGFLSVVIGVFFDKEYIFIAGFIVWFIGLIGYAVISESHIEEQEPCRCESCCCVKIERYE